MARSRDNGEQSESGKTPSQSLPHCPVVGIGASAGGIDALRLFVPEIKPGSGIAYVVVQHLDPEHASSLADLLARASRVPVRLIQDGMEIEPDHIYVIPPNALLTIQDQKLRLARPSEPRGQRYPVDSFFISLAHERPESSACVILSGTGSDGTLGLRAIKENGGLTLAQAGAEYDGMMRSALATGLVDFVLPAEEIPAKLAEYFRHIVEVGEKKGADGIQQEASDHLAQICTLLRTRTGHDFSGYKTRTLVRRIQRRMQVLQLEDASKFVERLRKDPQQIDMLFQDLLIGVTNFFRDRPAFAALESEVIPRIFEGKGADDSIRVWVPGCSTGEEAYSIAIMLRERIPKSHESRKLQIFASDIDEAALEIARFGRYPATIAKDVSPRRLERFFQREDGSYRVTADVREICLFSVHNLLRDAPFSKLDLISCRNVLIYLNPELQNRVIPLFHYALRDGGFLMLGSSENVTRHSRLFSVVDKPNRIFLRRPLPRGELPEFPLTAPIAPHRRYASPVTAGPAEGGWRELAERQLMERYTPAYVIVNGEGEVLHASMRTGKYLELPPGAPVTNVLSLARRGLRLDLRAALHKSAATQQVTIQKNVQVGTNGGQQVIDLVVQPLGPPSAQEKLYMVVFQDIGGIKPLSEHGPTDTVGDVEKVSVQQLEAELRATKERLQTTTEELESANEELKSGNEELSSINEELQSANEELETSKEELQSINEELQTVNAELNARVDELSRANNDIANLLESTQIATVFLDRELTVKSFTPAAKDLFHLVESDAGRPITHVRSRFNLDSVQEDAERVLRTLGTIEKQVKSTDTDARYIMRILPYRTVDNVIGGVVLTFTDITRMAAAEARITELSRDLRNRVDSLEALLDLVPVGIFIVDRDLSDVRVNRYGTRLLGEEDERKGPRKVAGPVRLFDANGELPVQDQPLQCAAASGAAIPSMEARLLRANGSFADVMISATPLFDEGGQVRGAIAVLVDITERKKVEAYQDVLVHELQHRVKNILATVSSLASRMLRDSPAGEEFARAFLNRLIAMGGMHDLLSQRSWEGADLRTLLSTALSPYARPDQSNVRLQGPEVLLKPGPATTLGMVLHELATNAAKYGALSSNKGGVEVSWEIAGTDKAPRVLISWVERDGPRIRPPTHEGFGATFVKRSIEYELDGRAELHFEPAGLRCTIELPWQDNGASPDVPTGSGKT